MASPTGSLNNASTEKSSSPDNKNNKTGVNETHPSSPNSDHAEPLSSRFPPIHLIVDLPIYGSISDQAPKGKQEKVLEDKGNEDPMQEREAVAAKSQEEAQVQANIQVMAKRLRAVFGDGSRPYKPRKRLCDVFGDVPKEESRVSSNEKFISSANEEFISEADEGFSSADECTSHPPKDQS